MNMDQRNFITVDVKCRNDDYACWISVAVNTELWDFMTPQKRHEAIEQAISTYYSGNYGINASTRWSFDIVAERDSKLQRTYSPGLVDREMGVTLTLREMLDYGVLGFEWEAKGYSSKAQMQMQEQDLFLKVCMMFRNHKSLELDYWTRVPLTDEWDAWTVQQRTKYILREVEFNGDYRVMPYLETGGGFALLEDQVSETREWLIENGVALTEPEWDVIDGIDDDDFADTEQSTEAVQHAEA